MTLTQQAIEILFDVQARKLVEYQKIKDLFEKACDSLPKEELQHMFMPVMKRIWNLIEQQKGAPHD